MRGLVGFLMSLVLGAVTAAVLTPDIRPIIGILTLPVDSASDGNNFSRVDSSYVRWLEGAGAVVVPILFNDTDANREELFHKLSGVLFTGGPDKPTDFKRYFAAATHLHGLAVQYGMPLWGTCLGFQTISDITAGGKDVLSDFDAYGIELPLQMTPAGYASKLFGNASREVVDLFTKANYTTNWHHYGVSPSNFSLHVGHEMVALSLNVDRAGAPFVSTMEHRTLPIYATQWHPEANAHDRDHATVDHSHEAVRAMQYLAAFFVQEARTKGLGPGDAGLTYDEGLVDIELTPLLPVAGSTSMKYNF